MPATDEKYEVAAREVDRIATEMSQAFNAHDWDLYSSFLAPSFFKPWHHRPDQPLGKEEFLQRMRELCESSPNYKIEVLDQTVMLPENLKRGRGCGDLSVFQNCRQLGNERRGDVVRDCVYILQFVQVVDGSWLCKTVQGANGCRYFDVAT